MKDYYQEGYNAGYGDGINGEEDRCAGLVYGFLSMFINTGDQDEWERGYEDGYAAGHEAYVEANAQ